MGWSLDWLVNLVEVPKEHQRGFLFSPFFAFPWFQEWSISFTQIGEGMSILFHRFFDRRCAA
jgi:hypothetical protein